MDNNINILDELHKGADMGVEAIDMILKKVDEHSLADLLEEYKERYDSISLEIKDLYHHYSDDEIHEVNMPEKVMAWYGIMKDTIFDGSNSKVAEIMINGTVMGIIEGRKILNHKKMDKKVHHICEKFVKMQEKFVEQLKDYL
ncbi:MAG: hypothetical protein IJG68_00805 [Bacilli bacterium]|nr:hypothetical protein [Bacilli bacterium]